jgi:hypothetical protein
MTAQAARVIYCRRGYGGEIMLSNLSLSFSMLFDEEDRVIGSLQGALFPQ